MADYAEFLDLRTRWNEVVGDRSVFLRHEWFDAAWQWRRLDESIGLAVYCAYRGKRLVGALPLVEKLQGSSAIASRRLEYLTVPDTQLCDLVAEEQDRAAVADAIAVALIRRAGDWDLLDIPYLGENAAARAELRRALESRNVHVVDVAAGSNPFVNLETSWRDYYAQRSRSLKKANNLAANRLARAGEVRVQWIEPGGQRIGDALAALEAAVAISATSWKRRTGNSLDSPGPHAFIRRLSMLAVDQQWLSLWVLWLNERPMAMEYQLVFSSNVHALRSDFVETDDEISPGSYLSRYMLERLFGRRLRRYLMGPGDNPYKRRWTEDAEPLFQLSAYSPSLRGRLARLWHCRAKPALRIVKGAMTPGKGSTEP